MTVNASGSGLFFLWLLLLTITGCAPVQTGQIEDLRVFPQDAAYYLQETGPESAVQLSQQELFLDYRKHFFSPWTRQKPLFNSEDVFWALKVYAGKNLFGENNLPLDNDWLRKMEHASDPENYPSRFIRAVSVVHLSMRALPTDKPLFYDPSRPGEGFPFDYMQNTLIPAASPLLITHAGRDGRWLLAETDYAAGWVRAHEVARIDQAFMTRFMESSLAGFLDDQAVIRDSSGEFLVSGRVGMSIAQAENQDDPERLKLLVPVRDFQGQAKLIPGFCSRNSCRTMPFDLNKSSLSSIMNSLMGQKYGWGGLYANRDCSALIKDVLSGFGIYLPRNSRGQAGAGRFISLDGLEHAEKQKIIREKGVPGLSILYMPGHVMLYLGVEPDSGKIAVYHSMWGLRTWRPLRGPDGRWIIGRTVITSLEPGREMAGLVRPEGLLIHRITGLVQPWVND